MNNTDNLNEACRSGDLNEVKRLHALGADIHAWNDYAFLWASLNGHLEVVKYLVENGCDIHARRDFAFRSARDKGHLEVVKYLQKADRIRKLEKLLK